MFHSGLRLATRELGSAGTCVIVLSSCQPHSSALGSLPRRRVPYLVVGFRSSSLGSSCRRRVTSASRSFRPGWTIQPSRRAWRGFSGSSTSRLWGSPWQRCWWLPVSLCRSHGRWVYTVVYVVAVEVTSSSQGVPRPPPNSPPLRYLFVGFVASPLRSSPVLLKSIRLPSSHLEVMPSRSAHIPQRGERQEESAGWWGMGMGKWWWW
jgi:hypothetical protein